MPTNSAPPPPLQVDGQPIEIVEEFKYLGSYMSSTDKDVNARIALAWGAFSKLKKVLKSRSRLSLRVRLFNAACISILLYGCESWVMTPPLAHKLDVFARTCYRLMLDIRQSDVHMTNQELYRRVGAINISSQVKARQLQFTGHCLRMPIDEPANIYALYSSRIANRRDAKTAHSYVDQIANHLCKDKQLKITADEITRYAQDRLQWSSFVAALKKPDP